MRKTTSSEFVEWCVFLEEEDWHHPTATHHYLAQIAATVQRFIEDFRSVFGGVKAQPVKNEDFLIKFVRTVAGQAWELVKKTVSGESKKPGGIVPGPEAVKDPKWAAVNAKAKAMWSLRLKRKSPPTRPVRKARPCPSEPKPLS